MAVVMRVEWFRASPRVGPAWQLRAEPSVFGFGAAFLASAVGAQILTLAFRLNDESPQLMQKALQGIGAHGAQLAVVAFILLARRFRPRGASTAVARGGVHQHPRALLESVMMAVAAALLLWPVIEAVGGSIGAIERWFGTSTPAVGHQTIEILLKAGTHDPWWWLTIASAVILAPLAEEFVYRGLLQQGLKAIGLSTRIAIVITSFLFAIMHWAALTDGSRLVGITVLFILAVGWGMLYERTGRIAAPVLAHAIFNATNLLIAFNS
jgi:membrane protease YdiL (CAAX protease family)